MKATRLFLLSRTTIFIAVFLIYSLQAYPETPWKTIPPGNSIMGDSWFAKMQTVNDAPTDIILSDTSVAENRPDNTVVGYLTTTDPDAGTHSYSLVSGTGSDDNRSFNISKGRLLTDESFNFETKSSYSIRLRTTDHDGHRFEKVFTITVTNINETPTGITLSGTSVSESQPVNTVVGTLFTADPDEGNTHTYTLVSGTGSSGNGSFNISDSSLRTSVIFDYESRSTYSIRVRTTDGGGLYYERVFTITVTRYTQAPTDIILSDTSVAENQPDNTVVGYLATTDPDAGTHIYSLVSGTGSDDNRSFNISQGRLQTDESFNFETKSSYSIRLRTTDHDGLRFEKVFTITVSNVNETPTGITLSGTSVPESQPVNTMVGSLSATDPDEGNTHTYTLVSGTGSSGNGSFNISDSSLRTSVIFDYESRSTYSIRVRTTDGGGLYYERVLTITVTRYTQTPTDIILSNASVAENQPFNTLVGILTAVDPNAADSHTYMFAAGTGSTDNASFTLSENELRTNATFDHETKSTYSIRLRVTDGGGLYYEERFTVTITNVNEAPVVTNVSITRLNNRIGTINTGTFTYMDPETGNFMEGIQLYKWYRKLPEDDTLWIDSVSTIAYIPVIADGGNSICFEVTPGDNLNLQGSPVKSPFQYINAAPVAGNVHIYAPDLRVSHNVYGRFNYSDLENNAAGRHTFQWYRSSIPSGTGTLISTATDSVYRLRVTEDDRYIRFVIIPAASAGSTPGSPVSSEWVGLVGNASPTAVISGSDTICSNGVNARINVNLTGEPTWSIRYRRVFSGRSEETTVSDIRYSPYIFNTTGEGTYTLLSVSDNNYTSGSVSGSAIVSYFPATMASLTGTAQICQDGASPVPMSIDFTGTSPWKIVLSGNTEDITYTGITQDPLIIHTKNPGIYKITGLYDKYCTGDTVAGLGTAIISYITSPKATLSGVDTTCPGDTAILRVRLEGVVPFSLTYLRNGANAKTISNIRQLNYTLKVVGNGTYTLSAVSDQIRSGCVSGTGTVVYYTVPTANLSGTGAICENSPANLIVTFTGTAPWNFSYHRNTGLPVSVANVTASPRYISLTKAGTYTLVNLSDKYCNGNVSGEAVVTVTPAPVVTISGLSPAYSVEKLAVPIFGNPDNGIFTPTLIEISDTNYFLPSYVGAGVHTIVYSYREPVTGCFGYDTAIVAVLAADAEITFPDNDRKKFFCNNDLPFTILGHNTANSLGIFTISGGAGLVDNHNNTATIYPSQLTGGNYQVTYRYYNEIYLEVKESFEIESAVELRFIEFDATSYCDNNNPVNLYGNVVRGIFSGRAVTGNFSDGYYYEPERSVPGLDTVFYTNITARGCTYQIFKSLTIKDAADINFTIENTCFSSYNADSTVFINHTTTTDTVETWNWNFGDNVSDGDNNSSLENPKHLYTTDGFKNITLTATTKSNCVSTYHNYFNIGDRPKADFEWATECFHNNRKVKFLNKSSSVNPEVIIDGYTWKFITGETYDSIVTKNAEYLYNVPGNYEVELIVHSNFGCMDTVRKTIPLRPTYLLEEGASYFENFEEAITGWMSVSEDTVNSWTLGQPAEGFNAADSGTHAWFTDITAERAPKEQSSVTSPCFSFTGIRKPMIKLNLWRLFNINQNDGAVLQYKADSSINWLNVGVLNDGINWYRDYSITGKPGQQPVGWSSGTLDNKWIEARHSLDELKDKTDVQLRIAYGSDGTAKGTNGMAFDNIWIGERNKMVLVEHFTNASVTASRTADSALDALANSNPFDIIDIQYHTSFPGADPFNEQNKVDPGTRVLFYQLSAVPVSILNGGISSSFRFDYDEMPLDPVLVKVQSLNDPEFSIDLQTTMMDNSLSVNAELRPLQRIMNRQVTLHIAIVERKITSVTGSNGVTSFESVLKTILSSTSYTNNWDPDVDFKTVTENWNLKHTYNTDEIRVIAFVQDEATREIYQAMIDKFDIQLAIDDDNAIHLSNGSGGFIAFPNPVCNEVFIRFDETVVKKTIIDLFDINGKLIMTKELFPGNKLYNIKIEDFPEGFYFIRITSDNQFIGSQKLVISR